jgi:hypothetical protein
MLTGDEDTFGRLLEVISQLARRCAGSAGVLGRPEQGKAFASHRNRLECRSTSSLR